MKGGMECYFSSVKAVRVVLDSLEKYILYVCGFANTGNSSMHIFYTVSHVYKYSYSSSEGHL